MDILKKAVLLVAILSISVFMAGCGGEEAADDAGAEAPAGSEPAESSGVEAVDLGDLLKDAQGEETEE